MDKREESGSDELGIHIKNKGGGRDASFERVIIYPNNDPPSFDGDGDVSGKSGQDVEIVMEYSPDKRYARLNTMLGCGSFKKVFKAMDREEGNEVAWNVIKISSFEKARNERESFLKEIDLLKSISHPSIIKIYDFWFTEKNFVFITELMTSGTLRDYVKKMDKPNIRVIRKWAKQILEGLVYLHSQVHPIIHRDIKCENIFINGSTCEVKIGDLGIAKKNIRKRYTMVGTPEFMAREMFEGDGYTEKVDIYAFGMCLMEMSTGDYPYSECATAGQVFKYILQGVPPNGLHKIPDTCLKNLVLKCIVSEKDRITAKECLEHHFFSPNNDCPGDCVPSDFVTVLPLMSPIDDMEVSMVSFRDNILTLQMFFRDSTKFIKFDFNTEEDTVEAVVDEMVEEEVVKNLDRVHMCKVLHSCIEKSKRKKANGMIKNGVIDMTKEGKNDEFECMELKPGEHVACNENKPVEFQDADAQHAPKCKKCADSPLVQTSGSGLPQKLASKEAKLVDNIEYPWKNYDDEISIEEFVSETASVTGRDQETASGWIKLLKEQDIRKVSDLKILVEEDWDNLGLTVFSSRAMKNMLYGKDKHPIKEKQQCSNPSIKEYEEKMEIKQFVEDVSAWVGRPGLSGVWELKLLTQDVRTMGELKSLHQNDWDRLGLSVFSYRIIKNVVFRKGKVVCNGKVCGGVS
jgi:WNK lysine deficient protein kinase